MGILSRKSGHGWACVPRGGVDVPVGAGFRLRCIKALMAAAA